MATIPALTATQGYIVPLTVLFEHCDDRLVYGTIFKQLADKYNDEMAYNIYYVDKQYYTIHEYEEYLEDIAVTDVKTGKKLTWEETMEVNGWRNTTEQEYWDEFSQYGQYLQVDDDGLYYGMGYKQKDYVTWAGDIKDNPRKDQTYCDRILWIGRHGNDPAGELPPASQDYSPVPFYQEPLESPLDPDVKAKYPLVASNGRLPYYHHSTLRNIPYLRETYPVPEIWIDPQAAAERGIETGDWVNVKSQRCEEQESSRTAFTRGRSSRRESTRGACTWSASGTPSSSKRARTHARAGRRATGTSYRARRAAQSRDGHVHVARRACSGGEVGQA